MSVAETITEFEPAEHQVAQRLDALLDRQRQAFLKDGYPSAAVRKDRLSRAIALLVDHQKEIADALDADFGCRSKDMSLFTDVVAPIDALKHARSHVTSWMKPDRRMATFPFNLMGGRAQVMPQPKGVVGLISPWNFPVQLTFGPLASILSAGNRAMIKPSEFTPETSALLGRMF
ncbi:MAG: aldehyde dehydrogenase family protein, partial [Pseudomonadota bacterium]